MSISLEEIAKIGERAECLVSLDEINAKLDLMAAEMNKSLADKQPVILCTMIGGVITSGMLLPRLSIPLELDYIHATRYGNSTVGYKLEWLAYPRVSLKDRCVVIVDDILDGGITLAEIAKHCVNEGAKEVHTAVLVDKLTSRSEGGLPKANFRALDVENRFLYGMGLDYKGYFRNAPGIFAVAQEDED